MDIETAALCLPCQSGMRVRVFPACRLGRRPAFRDTGQHDRRAVREFSDKRQIATHRLDGLPERGQQEVAALFEARNAVLGDPEGLGHADLRALAGLAELAQGHFLGNQLRRANLDLLALSEAQLPEFVINVHSHGYLLTLSLWYIIHMMSNTYSASVLFFGRSLNWEVGLRSGGRRRGRWGAARP